MEDSLLVSSYGPGELSYTLREPPAGLLDASGSILSLQQKNDYASPIKNKRVYIDTFIFDARQAAQIMYFL